MRPPISITITITGNIWPDYYYYYYYYSGILRSLLLLLLLSRHKRFITITITISNSLTTLSNTNVEALKQIEMSVQTNCNLMQKYGMLYISGAIHFLILETPTGEIFYQSVITPGFHNIFTIRNQFLQ